ncbi:MAG: zf-HC2 domain-containing protein [Candidatus Binatia bacterium]
MNCQEVRERSSEYLDQRLASTEVLLFEEHVKACSDCQQEVEALRTTISLISSLDEIKASPDFLNQLHRKIEKGRGMMRVWAWIAEPIKIKIPLEITALVILSTTAFYLYQRTPELSKEAGIPALFQNLQESEDKSQEEALGAKPQGYEIAERKATTQSRTEAKPTLPPSLSKPAEVLRDARQESARVAGAPSPKEARVVGSLEDQMVGWDELQDKVIEGEGKKKESPQTAKTATMPEPRPGAPSATSSVAKATVVPKDVRNELAAATRQPQVHEISTGDVGQSEARARMLLDGFGGRVLTQEALPGMGLLLTVELPQSRQADFLAALKEKAKEEAKISPPELGATGAGTVSKARQDFRQMDTQTARERALERKSAPAAESTLRPSEPTATLQLRILLEK